MLEYKALLINYKMNYVVVLMAAVAIFAVGYWYAAGRYYYIGPRVKAQLIVGVEGEGKGAMGGPGLGELSGGSSNEMHRGELNGEKAVNEVEGTSKPTGELM